MIERYKKYIRKYNNKLRKMKLIRTKFVILPQKRFIFRESNILFTIINESEKEKKEIEITIK
jgi:hypothetical protein